MAGRQRRPATSDCWSRAPNDDVSEWQISKPESFLSDSLILGHICLNLPSVFVWGVGGGVFRWEHLQIFLKVSFSKCWKALSKVTCGRLMCKLFHGSTRPSAAPFSLWFFVCILLIFNNQLFIYNANFSAECWEMVYQKGWALDNSNKRRGLKFTFRSHRQEGQGQKVQAGS